MNQTIATIISVLIPLSFFVLPGAGIIWRKHPKQHSITAALTLLWSISILTVGSFISVALHLPVILVWVASAIVTGISLRSLLRTFPQHSVHQRWLFLGAIAIFVFSLFSLPFLIYHEGLPTGDSQKSILWASTIISSGQLPDYQTAPALLNRDPVDFFTPALHTFIALLASLSPNPLLATGLLAIALGIGTAIIGAAIARTIFPKLPAGPLIALTGLLLLTNIRFLRYLREPGYHLQNLFGEFLLFGALLTVALLLSNWHASRRINVSYACLLLLLLLSLLLGHQFSIFIAAFIFLPFAMITSLELWRYRKKLPAWFAVVGVITVTVLVVSGFALGLQQKITHIFTTDAHLLGLTPSLLDYPRLMGTTWLMFGLIGLVFMVRNLRRSLQSSPIEAAFAIAILILLGLSQGPRLGIDIPPVRALFYAAVPLSITGAVALLILTQYILKQTTILRVAGMTILTIIVGQSAISSIAEAYTLSHTVRTNSTLTQGQLLLASQINKAGGGAVLVDDFNRRSSSWLVLGNQPMYTRIASDLARQMDEAKQSELRYQLYLHQLDYEKIFSLGSLSLAADLMNKHNITFVTGIAKSSETAFARNPILTPFAVADDITLYRPLSGTDACSQRLGPATHDWLLRAATIANDIGDDEDTFLHLPASVRSPAISDPGTDGTCTHRITTASEIPLFFNVGDYVLALWDTEATNRPDSAVEVLISLTTPAADLSIRDTTGSLHPIPETGIIRLLPTEATINDQGFILLSIVNPDTTPVGIDLVALGPAHIP